MVPLLLTPSTKHGDIGIEQHTKFKNEPGGPGADLDAFTAGSCPSPEETVPFFRSTVNFSWFRRDPLQAQFKDARWGRTAEDVVRTCFRICRS